MGITIDEAIYCMKSYLPSDDYIHCTECKYYGCKDNKTCVSNEAHQIAINTMRKYKQIEEIYKNWCYPTYFNATDAMNKLGEVLKDGNDD